MSSPAGDGPGAMSAEFDTVAAWTADAAVELGPTSFVAAGSRGSASPALLRWLLDRLELAPNRTFLDVGAGVGGPAAYAAAETGVTPVLTDPERGACAAADRLFGFPTLQAVGPLPFRDGCFDTVWSLGVLCTVADQPAFLQEVRRVLAPHGQLGLLVFLTGDPERSDQLAENHFPTGDGLLHLLAATGWEVVDSVPASALGQAPPEWDATVAAVDRVIARDHGESDAWRLASAQSRAFGTLLQDGVLGGRLLVARPTAG